MSHILDISGYIPNVFNEVTTNQIKFEMEKGLEFLRKINEETCLLPWGSLGEEGLHKSNAGWILQLLSLADT